MRVSICPVKLLMVLYEIIVQLSVHGGVFNLPICLKKCLDAIGVPFRPHSAANIVEEKFQVQVPLILNDHVVENCTSFYDVNETFLVPKMSWVTNNSRSSLQSTKSSLNILSASFLCLCKFSLFFLFWVLEWFS
jgi:hypothetical protein